MKVKLLSRVRLLATPWTAAHQAPPSMGVVRQEHKSGVPVPSPRRNPSLQQLQLQQTVNAAHGHQSQVTPRAEGLFNSVPSL